MEKRIVHPRDKENTNVLHQKGQPWQKKLQQKATGLSTSLHGAFRSKGSISSIKTLPPMSERSTSVSKSSLITRTSVNSKGLSSSLHGKAHSNILKRHGASSVRSLAHRNGRQADIDDHRPLLEESPPPALGSSTVTPTEEVEKLRKEVKELHGLVENYTNEYRFLSVTSHRLLRENNELCRELLSAQENARRADEASNEMLFHEMRIGNMTNYKHLNTHQRFLSEDCNRQVRAQPQQDVSSSATPMRNKNQRAKDIVQQCSWLEFILPEKRKEL